MSFIDTGTVRAMPMKMRHQENVKRIGAILLAIVAAAGIVVVAAAAPGIVGVAKLFPRKPEWQRRYLIDRALRRLLRRGLVEEVHRGRTVEYALTDTGREYLMRCELAHAEVPVPKKWDGKWRFIMFDIQEKRRHLRDNLRTHLNRLGLYPIQKSVWLTPYPCADLVRLIKVDLGLGRRVQCLTVRKFDDREEEKSWRLHFDV